MEKPPPQRPWLRPLLWVLGIFAVAAAAMSYMFFGLWTDLADALPSEAEQAFTVAIADAGGGPPYIEIRADGSIVVHRELKRPEPQDFKTLTVLAWMPAEQKLLRLDYPHWFVRLKTASSINLGTMIAAARQDWGHLDLNITYDDLRRRGPALVLDHRLQNGARIVLWTAG